MTNIDVNSGGVYNMGIVKGETFDLPMVWRSDGVTPTDVTGCTGAMKIRTLKGDLICDVAVAGTITFGTTDGLITIHLSNTVTSALPAGTHKYGLFVTKNGSPRRLLYGAVVVHPSEELG